MTQDQMIASARRVVEDGIGRGDLGILDELMATDLVEHQRGNANGIGGARAVVETLHRWMPDFELTIQDIVVSGETVWTRNRARGTNTGSVMGHPPTGRTVEMDVFDVLRFANGKVVEHWGVADQLGLLIQLGIVPSGRSAVAPSV